MDHHTVYSDHVAQPYGRHYAQTVGRFQEGFLRDRVTDDLEVAFERAVETAERLITIIRARA